MLIQSPKNQKLFKSFLVGHDQKKNGCGQSGPWYKFLQIKRHLKILGVGMAKKGFGQCCDRNLKLTLCEEWIDGMNFACWCRFTNNKNKSKFFLGEHSQKLVCGHGTQQLTVSQKWADGIDWYPALWLLNAGGSLWLYFSLFVYLFCLMSFQLFSAP